MPKFRPDNTAGYTEAELAELNARYETALGRTDQDASDPQVQQWWAEKIQQEFDSD